MPKNEMLSYSELERYLELTGSLRRVMSEEMRGQIERGPQLKEAFSLIRQAEESIRMEMREVRYELLKKSWRPVTPEAEMEQPETREQPIRFRAPETPDTPWQQEFEDMVAEREGRIFRTRPWQGEGPGPLDIREG
jgi:hypothetical protein